jgi:hypothetical protein
VTAPKLTPEEREELDRAEVAEIMSDNGEAGEAAQLRALLASSSSAYPYQDGRYLDLTDEGGELAGFVTVSEEEGDESRWQRWMHMVTRGPSGKHYAWTWRRGLTESQDSEYWDEPVQLVERHEETRVVVTWKPVAAPSS